VGCRCRQLVPLLLQSTLSGAKIHVSLLLHLAHTRQASAFGFHEGRHAVFECGFLLFRTSRRSLSARRRHVRKFLAAMAAKDSVWLIGIAARTHAFDVIGQEADVEDVIPLYS
jgi:hypothetical protein